MSRNHIMGNIKKLLMCSKRQYTVGDNSASMCSSTDSDHADAASSDSSTMCQPRITLRELRRRRQLQRRVPFETWNGEDYTSSPKTISGGSLTIHNNVAQDPQRFHQLQAPADRRAPNNLQQAARLQHQGYQAEICLMDSCDDRCIVVRPSNLVVTDYEPAESLTSKQNPKVMNNVMLCYQRQLNAEICEINSCPTNNLTMKSSELGVNMTRFSNQAVFQPSSCNSTQLNAFRRSVLRVQKMSDLSEPKSVFASLTSSEEPSCRCPCCFPYGDVRSAAEAAISAGVVEGDIGETPKHERIPTPVETGNVTAQTNDQVDNRSGHTQQFCPNCRVPLARGLKRIMKASRDRCGALSSELCLNLCEVASGADLVQRYLEKRKISEKTRIRHEQRCGRMREDLLQKILAVAAAAAPGSFLEESASRSETLKESATTPTSSSAVYSDIFWKAYHAFKNAPRSAASTAMAMPVQTVMFDFLEPGPESRSPQERRRARIRAVAQSSNYSGAPFTSFN